MRSIKTLALATASAVGSMLPMVQTVKAAEVTGINITPGTGYALNVSTLFSSILNIVMLIAALLVFGFLIMGGIEWITSGGDKGKTESARNKITSAIVGLLVVAASYALVTLVVNFLGFNGLGDVFNIGNINSPK
jgi:cytochrome bd-type quinol oxidase subunit 2